MAWNFIRFIPLLNFLFLFIAMKFLLCSSFPAPNKLFTEDSKGTTRYKGTDNNVESFSLRKASSMHRQKQSLFELDLRKDVHQIKQVFMPTLLQSRKRKLKRDRRTSGLRISTTNSYYPNYQVLRTQADNNKKNSFSSRVENTAKLLDIETASTSSGSQLSIKAIPQFYPASNHVSVNSTSDLPELSNQRGHEAHQNETAAQLLLLHQLFQEWEASSGREFQSSIAIDRNENDHNRSSVTAYPKLRYSFVREWLKELHSRNQKERSGGSLVKRNAGSGGISTMYDVLSNMPSETRLKPKQSNGKATRNSMNLVTSSTYRNDNKRLDGLYFLYMDGGGRYLRVSETGLIKGVSKQQRDVYCVIRFHNYNLQSHVKLQGAKSGRFIAMRDDASIYTTLHANDQNTSFVHKYYRSHETFRSIQHHYLLAFKRNGKPSPTPVEHERIGRAKFLSLSKSLMLEKLKQQLVQTTHLINSTTLPKKSHADETQKPRKRCKKKKNRKKRCRKPKKPRKKGRNKRKKGRRKKKKKQQQKRTKRFISTDYHENTPFSSRSVNQLQTLSLKNERNILDDAYLINNNEQVFHPKNYKSKDAT